MPLLYDRSPARVALDRQCDVLVLHSQGSLRSQSSPSTISAWLSRIISRKNRPSRRCRFIKACVITFVNQRARSCIEAGTRRKPGRWVAPGTVQFSMKARASGACLNCSKPGIAFRGARHRRSRSAGARLRIATVRCLARQPRFDLSATAWPAGSAGSTLGAGPVIVDEITVYDLSLNHLSALAGFRRVWRLRDSGLLAAHCYRACGNALK